MEQTTNLPKGVPISLRGNPHFGQRPKVGILIIPVLSISCLIKESNIFIFLFHYYFVISASVPKKVLIKLLGKLSLIQ